MKKVLIVLGLVLSTSAVAATDWSGASQVRYRTFRYDDGLNSSTGNGDTSIQERKTFEIRNYLKSVTKLTDGWSGEFGIRTTGTATSYYNTVNNASDMTVGLELANAQWKSTAGEAVTTAALGRQKNAFDYESFMQNLWDNDLRFDGVSGTHNKGSWGVNAAAYVLGAENLGTFGGSGFTYTSSSQAVGNTNSGMAYLLGVQPTWKWKSEKVNVTAALAHYRWLRATGYTNRVHMGYNSSTLNAAANTGTVQVHNPRQWQGLVKADMPNCNLKASFEWLLNKKMFYGNGDAMDRAAWAATLGYREAKKQGDWAVTYGYAVKGLAATPGSLSTGEVLPDTKAHALDFVVMPADQFQLGLAAYFSKEKSRKAATGVDIATSQDQKARALYFSAGVKF